MATETLTLTLEPRKIIGKEVKKLRREGILPIAVFGQNISPYNAQVNERDFMKVVNKAGYTSLITLEVQGEITQQAFVQELQRHPVSLRIIHADLHVVDVNQPMTVDVPIILFGENRQVEANRAILNQPIHSIQIHALPTNIPHQIDVDVSGLADFGDSIQLRDIEFPGNVEVLADMDEVVVTLNPAPRASAETETAEATEAEAPEATEAEDEDEA